jgi:hypothetical protein
MTMMVPAIVAMPGGHDQKEVAARNLFQIGLDQQGRFHMAQEDIGRHPHPRGTAQAQGFAQHPGETPHHPGQDPPVKEQGREGADHQHHGQGLEGEYKGTAPGPDLEGQVAPAHIAKDEASARAGRRLQAGYQFVQDQEDMAEQRNFQQQQGDGELEDQGHESRPETHRPPVFTKQPGQEKKAHKPDQTLGPHRILPLLMPIPGCHTENFSSG